MIGESFQSRSTTFRKYIETINDLIGLEGFDLDKEKELFKTDHIFPLNRIRGEFYEIPSMVAAGFISGHLFDE